MTSAISEGSAKRELTDNLVKRRNVRAADTCVVNNRIDSAVPLIHSCHGLLYMFFGTHEDNTAIRESAHTLKGASCNMRAATTTAAAAELETAAHAGATDQIPALADKLKTEVQRTMEYLQSKVA